MRTTIARVVDTLKALVGLADYPHSYLCFAHGGSAACEAMNRRLGFTCPKCTKPNRKREGHGSAYEHRIIERSDVLVWPHEKKAREGEA
jgi:hypothetical protein